MQSKEIAQVSKGSSGGNREMQDAESKLKFNLSKFYRMSEAEFARYLKILTELTTTASREEKVKFISDLKKFRDSLPEDGDLTPLFKTIKLANNTAIFGVFGSVLHGLYGLVTKDYESTKNAALGFFG